MAEFPVKLSIVYSSDSLDDLDAIWEWNANQHGEKHANLFREFLKSQTQALAKFANPGREVPTCNIYRYSVIKRRSRGYGHIVIFRLTDEKLIILRYFHMAQDWQTKVSSSE